MTCPIKLSQERTFRQTPGVHFADIGIAGVNGLDLVEHFGPSVSPPLNEQGQKQWYCHSFQTDNNRCLRGHRLFELFYPRWEVPHWFVMLDDKSGALEIPPGCLHRSYSGLDGSLLINQPIRDAGYNEETEFIPVTTWRWRGCATGYHGCTPRSVADFIASGAQQ